MTDRDWQQRTAIEKIRRELNQPNPPPIGHLIADAARYVGSTASVVAEWWRRRT